MNASFSSNRYIILNEIYSFTFVLNFKFLSFYSVILPVFREYSELCQTSNTAGKMKFLIKDFFSKCDQIRSFLQIRSHLLNTEEILNGQLHFLCGLKLNVIE